MYVTHLTEVHAQIRIWLVVAEVLPCCSSSPSLCLSLLQDSLLSDLQADAPTYEFKSGGSMAADDRNLEVQE